MAKFELQPAESELQQLAEQYWKDAGPREQELEKAAFEAGGKRFEAANTRWRIWRRLSVGSLNG